jgi:hypothetical protein
MRDVEPRCNDVKEKGEKGALRIGDRRFYNTGAYSAFTASESAG